MAMQQNEHPIRGLMDTTLEKIRTMVDSNTIIGTPIHTADGTMIIPVSRMSFGFASGGSDFPSKTNKDLFGGGGGAGVSVTPVAFLVVKDGNVIEQGNHDQLLQKGGFYASLYNSQFS